MIAAQCETGGALHVFSSDFINSQWSSVICGSISDINTNCSGQSRSVGFSRIVALTARSWLAGWVGSQGVPSARVKPGTSGHGGLIIPSADLACRHKPAPMLCRVQLLHRNFLSRTPTHDTHKQPPQPQFTEHGSLEITREVENGRSESQTHELVDHKSSAGLTL